MKNYERILKEEQVTMEDLLTFALIDTDVINNILDDMYIDIKEDDIEELKQDLYKTIMSK